VVSVRRDQIKSMWDIAAALADYLKAHPLESGKPVDSVFQVILLESGLLSSTPYQSPRPAPASGGSEAELIPPDVPHPRSR